MSKPAVMPTRRARAYAFAAVTTVVVLLFALAEWGVERFVSEHSRVASVAIEIAIVLIAALVFRPIHQRVEAAIEGAIYRRKRLSLAALATFRRELTSFNDASQLLRRVVEAVEQHMEASACAVYLRRDEYRAEVSTFDTPAEPVPQEDPLIVRLRSSSATAQQSRLNSAILGDCALPMTVAGEVVGVLAIRCREGGYDADETQALAGLAQDLALAIVGLDPILRRTRVIPNNVPANLPELVGRERELGEIETALAEYRLLTLCGVGGVGKTSLALRCAANAIAQHEQGAWFVNLAPITDGELVTGAIISALDIDARGSDELHQVLDHLRPLDMLLVIDNCEQVIGEVSTVVRKILTECPRVRILATSREILHVEGERVYRLGPLRSDAAVEMFMQRAAAVEPAEDLRSHEETIRRICEHLDGLPLAIELAAARIRALSVEEIAGHLHERFRLLTGGARSALARQKTLAATIEWSYDLLATNEQSLFCRLAVFRGSFSLAAAAAVCSRDRNCDEFQVLDQLTSLADKSLLSVTVGLTTRYHFLESIREFAAAKAQDKDVAVGAAHHHAAYFAALAAQAYHEFDSRLPEDWLDRLAPDIDNFRAALDWTLGGRGERQTGAQLAADCGPVFLRMELLGEGLRWCAAAREVPNLAPATAGRLEYVASMMYNNLNDTRMALTCAERAVSFYEQSADERGTIRVLSQVAQLYARTKRYDAARTPANEAIRRARALGEPRVVTGVLRRCAFALPRSDIETARAYYKEALDLARSTRDNDEACLVTSWWAYDEAACGRLERAVELGSEAMRCADRDSEKVLENQLTAWLLALRRFDEAAPHARKALTLAVEAQHEQLIALGIAYCATFHAETNAEEAAMIFGYARSRLAQLGWESENDDRAAFAAVEAAITGRLLKDEYEPLLERGGVMQESEVLKLLSATSALRREGSDAPVKSGGYAVRALLI